jgi:crotonobetainyl-CoA:carnitine CoA-transferase CaiB-like acyl-CoA transferase
VTGTLEGLKVVEFAHLIAGPLAGTLLADLGADVVHVESPGVGDEARRMGPAKGDVYLWWKVSGRNKRSVTLDLRREEGRSIARRLAEWADVVITNLRPSTLVDWRLDFSSLHAVNPRLVFVQISGSGATTEGGAASSGFGKAGEARSGVVHITGEPDGPPLHVGFSHGDSVTALMGAFSAMSALWRRHDESFAGEWVDIALFESLFRLIEWQVILYDQLGTIPARRGNRTSVSPAAVVNTYKTRDGDWITVTSATAKSVENVARLLGLPVSEYRTREQQRAAADDLDEQLAAWILSYPTAECLATLEAADVVASRIFSVKDIVEDPLYADREDIVSVHDEDLGSVRMQAVVPKNHVRPGSVWRTGPALGVDNDLVFRDWLKMDAAEYDALVADGVI